MNTSCVEHHMNTYTFQTICTCPADHQGDADAPRNSLAGILRKDLLSGARAKLKEFRRRRLEGIT